ncbi:hypothetical protein CL652_01855 [bacterium]|nr:hypothetical protein [bacterium]
MKPKSPRRTGKGFFKVPHALLENPAIVDSLTHAEFHFLMVLLKLFNQYGKQSEDGSFWHTDKLFTAKDGAICGFEQYKLSTRVCKSARKKLVQLGLIETRRERSANGVRYGGTVYRLTDTSTIANTKGAKSALGRERNDLLQKHHPDPRIREIYKKKKELIRSFNMNSPKNRRS